MLKKFKIIIFIFISIFLMQSCKSPTLDFEWFLFEAEGSYSSESNTSYIKLNAWVKLNQSSININPGSATDSTHFQSASVISWIYRIYSGDQLLFEIGPNNVNLHFKNILLNVGEEQIDYLWVAIESEDPIAGDFFNGLNPDRVEVEMAIYDNDQNSYFISNSVPFIFDRN
ncbi:MAG: hypothetical protein ABFR36_00045 [Acidobacteriota bacterium]